MKKRIVKVLCTVVAVFALAVPSFAAELTATNSVLQTAFEGAATNILDTVGIVLPIALGVMTAVIAIKFGIAFFKKLTSTSGT